jgi:hypothetical protein
MNKLSKEKKEKLIIVCMATGFLLAILNYFLIGMQQDTLARYDRQIADKKDKVEKADMLLKMAPRIQANLEGSKKLLAEKEQKMAPPDQYRWLVELVPPFMSARNVNFENCTTARIEPPGLLPKFNDYKSAVFTVKATARFQDFGKFLADFENDFPYMIVQIQKIGPDSMKNALAAAPNAFDSVARRSAPAEMSESAEKLMFTMKIVTLVKP